MCSASQKPYRVDDVVYESEVLEKSSRRYSSEYNERFYLQITAHRVIQVNYQYRTVRIRCANGCERALSYGGDTCPRTKYWHTLDEARKELGEKVEKQMVEDVKALAELQAKVKHHELLRKQAKTFNVIKIPTKVENPADDVTP
jgi:hypothetical protein